MTARAFIFDLDGTLVDALPDIQANINRALNQLGYSIELDAEQTKPHVGGGAQKLAASVLGLPLDHPQTMALYEAFTASYELNPAAFGRPFPTVLETLQALRAKNIPLACVTAKPARARVKVLDALDLTRYLVCALSPEDGYAKKPAPDMLLECCRQMGVAPNETWMVGDTEYDLEAGFRAGCQGVGFARHGYAALPESYRGRVLELDDFTPLLTLI